MICTVCKGKGRIAKHGQGVKPKWIDCYRCEGQGSVQK